MIATQTVVIPRVTATAAIPMGMAVYSATAQDTEAMGTSVAFSPVTAKELEMATTTVTKVWSPHSWAEVFSIASAVMVTAMAHTVIRSVATVSCIAERA